MYIKKSDKHAMANYSYCLDADVLITAWNVYYRPQNFPSFYKELATKLPKSSVYVKEIFSEIRVTENIYNGIDLRTWIQNHKISIIRLSSNSDILKKSFELQIKYEVREGSNGVKNNDLLLIAFAKAHKLTVVTYEGKQKEVPGEKCNYKIPLVCKKEGVRCINPTKLFTELKISA